MDTNNTAQLNADKLRVFRHELEYNNLDTRLIATDVRDKCEMRAPFESPTDKPWI